MKELERMLKDLQALKYEQVEIVQVLNWIASIRWNKRIKVIERNENTKKGRG